MCGDHHPPGGVIFAASGGGRGIFLESVSGACAAPDPRLLLPRGKSNQKRAGTKVPDLLCLGHWAEMKSIGCPVNEQFFFWRIGS